MPQRDVIQLIKPKNPEPPAPNAILPKMQHALRKRRQLGDVGFVWFLRLLSAFCLIIGLLWAVRIVGIYEGELWRFDLMPTPWKLATLIMGLLYLFAAVGLWLLAPWGMVVWFLAAIAEIIIHGPYGDIFGYRPFNIVINVAIALLFAAFRLWQEQQQRAERQSAIR